MTNFNGNHLDLIPNDHTTEKDSFNYFPYFF